MLNWCRICLCTIDPLNSVNVYLKTTTDTLPIEIMKVCASIEVALEDDLPNLICTNCSVKLNFFYGFRNLIISSDMFLKTKIRCREKLGIQHEITENIPNEPIRSKIVEVLIKEESTDTPIIENCDNNPIKIVVPPRGNPIQSQGLDNRLSTTLNEEYKTEHARVKPYICEICNKGFGAEISLIVHTRVHTGEKPLSCSICQKKYRFPGNLRVHEKKHKGLIMFSCEICNKGFYESYGFRNHMRTHTGEKPFMCELCGKTFADYSSFLTHKAKLHETKKLPCSICGKIFKDKVGLRVHIRRHSGLKKYGCDECGKKFTESSSLKTHRNAVHLGIKAHKCTVCEKSFSQGSTLTTHMLTHSGEKRFPCTLCPKEFAYKQHLQSHVKKHHKDVEETT